MPASRRRLVNAALVAGSTLGALGVVEGGMRLLHISFPSFYTLDADRGFAHQPGASGWFKREGHAFVRINSDGLRDREHARAKPPGMLRITVLGDSYTEAVQVEQEQGFCSVVQRELRQCEFFARQDVEVLNFGVASYGTAQELLTLRHHVWQYAPDLVLLAFLTDNDIQENSRALLGDAVRPYFMLQGDSLRLDTSFRDTPAYRQSTTWRWRLKHRAVERSCVFQLVCEASRAAKRQWHAANGHEDSPGLVYREPTDPDWQEAWCVTERLLLEMRDECAKHGTRFAVVTLSNPIQVHPDPEVRRQFMQRLKIPDLFYPDGRIQALGEREGFPVLCLAPALRIYAEEHRTCLHGFPNAVPCGGHWNVEGHRVAGTLIADFICARATTALLGEPEPAPR